MYYDSHTPQTIQADLTIQVNLVIKKIWNRMRHCSTIVRYYIGDMCWSNPLRGITRGKSEA
jgi:hypothetical protein